MLSVPNLPAAETTSLLLEVLAATLAATALGHPAYAPDGTLTEVLLDYLNPAGHTLLAPPEPAAPTFSTYFPASQRPAVLALCQQVAATGEPGQLAVAYLAPGRPRPAQLAVRRSGARLVLSLAPVPTAEGAASALALRTSEASEAAAIAEAQRQRAQLYHMLEQAPAMICVFGGPQHVFEFVNPPYQALVGQRPLVGLPLAEAMPELVGQELFSLLDRVYQTGETYYAHDRLVQLDHANDGRRELDKRYYDFIYQARRNAAGAIDGIFTFAYEVTTQVMARQQTESLNAELANVNEELQAANEELIANNNELIYSQMRLGRLTKELELRVQERTRTAELAQATAEFQRAQLNELFMQAPAAICVLAGPSWIYELVNASYQRSFPGRRLLGKPLLEALPELRETPLPTWLAHVYATGETYHAQELPVRLARVQGGPLEDVFWTFTYQARRDALGQIDGVLVFAFDMSEPVRARQLVEASQQRTQALADELTRTNTRLRSVNADLDSFVYAASHDLKAPITNIEGLAQALREELNTLSASPIATTILGLMADSVGRFQRTISSLTDVSRLQQSYAAAATPVPLRALVDDICLDLRPLLTVSGGSITVDPDSCPTILFAEKNLRSVVFNLLSNALKYRHPQRPPLVRVGCHPDGAGAIVLEVEDNGLGLTPAQQAQVFDMFQRLHDHVEGSGVGLYLVKKVVENTGGRISVRSQPGEGSTFTVVLPGQAQP